MKTEHRILKQAVFPLVMLMVVLAIGTLVNLSAHRLAEQQAMLIEDGFMAAKRTELQNYIDLAKSAIEPLYNSGRDDAATQEQAKAILRSIDYGNNGYFFVYDLHGNNLVHPRQPELEGNNLGGMPVIRSLLHVARHGDGFLRYLWRKPSTQQETEKLGYVVLLQRWGWMMGTGIYLDDVAQTTLAVRSHVTGTLEKLMAVTLAALLMVFLIGIILNTREHRIAEGELKTMAQRIVVSQEEERARVSRELHEGLAAPLCAAKWAFERAADSVSKDAERVNNHLRNGLDKLVQALKDVRRISHGLRPAALDKLGLSAAIDQLKAEFVEYTGIRVHTDITLGDYRFNEQEEVALYRIAQEALTNIERHATATQVRITLTRDPEGIKFIVADNGCGFDAYQLSQNPGIGLRNMRERVEYLNGFFELHSEPGCTRLTVRLPGTPKQP